MSFEYDSQVHVLSAVPLTIGLARLTFVPKNNLAMAMLSGGHAAIGADTATHNELMAIIKRSGVGCRAESLLDNLLQEISELRGVVAAEQSESKLLKVQTFQRIMIVELN